MMNAPRAQTSGHGSLLPFLEWIATTARPFQHPRLVDITAVEAGKGIVSRAAHWAGSANRRAPRRLLRIQNFLDFFLLGMQAALRTFGVPAQDSSASWLCARPTFGVNLVGFNLFHFSHLLLFWIFKATSYCLLLLHRRGGLITSVSGLIPVYNS